jgi:hypothetical protein
MKIIPDSGALRRVGGASSCTRPARHDQPTRTRSIRRTRFGRCAPRRRLRSGRSTVTQRVSSRAGAPPSPRALPSFQAGCSRQRESSSMRRRAGLPMLLREVSFLEGHSGSPRPGLDVRRGRSCRERWSALGDRVHAAC